ncbi:MAG: hypothetical protein ACOC5E_03200 [Acidobacteriota bacterium]
MSRSLIRRLLEQDRATPGCAACGRTDVELEPDVPLCRSCRREIENEERRREFSRGLRPRRWAEEDDDDDLPF